ncbi:hypothetical protein NGA_2075800, partial [Nannochloropsis gaditana CCMP526]|uniref:uncharacterized protein n=1 Tax=Nannochloropsis gaditana (strain CCMP526) TaxID=1093141 RepID=UPI00029F7780
LPLAASRSTSKGPYGWETTTMAWKRLVLGCATGTSFSASFPKVTMALRSSVKSASGRGCPS